MRALLLIRFIGRRRMNNGDVVLKFILLLIIRLVLRQNNEAF